MANRFLSNITINDAYTFPSADGDNGQVIGTDGAGNLSFIDQTTEALTLNVTVKNKSGGSLAKGTIVHAHPSANPPSGNVVEVIAADYDTSTSMPAIGVLNETLANEAEGQAIMFGAVSGIDTSSFSAGDELWVGNNGAFTNTKPATAGQLIQKIAVVIKSHASNGLIKIFGAGRTNDVPLPLYIDNTNQRVGIGISTPASPLHINTGTGVNNSNTVIIDRAGASDYSAISFATSGTVDWSIGHNSAGNFEVFENGADATTRLTIKTGGNIGIGNTNPSQKLHVSGGDIMVEDGSTAHVYLHNTSNYLYGDTNGVGILNANNNLRLLTVGVERLRINSSGNIGIGTASPSARLHIEHANNTSGLYVFTQSSTIPSVPQIRIGRNAAEYFGVLTDDGISRLIARQDETAGDTHAMDFEIWSSASNQTWSWQERLQDGSSPTYRMVLKNGDLGIGTVSPSEKLDVSGNINLTGALKGPSTFYIDPSPDDTGEPGGATTDTGTVVILGDLQVTGTTTTIDSTTLNVGDKNIVLAKDATTAAAANGSGITINGANATMTYNSSDDRFEFNKAIRSSSHVLAGSNVYSGDASSFRNYGGVWKATTGLTGNGFQFVSADGTAMTISSVGDVVTSGDITIGDGTVDNSLTVKHSDNSRVEIHGYGIQMSRSASYIRPTSDASQDLYVGNSGTSTDWRYIYFKYDNSIRFNKNGTETFKVDDNTTIVSGNLVMGSNTVIDSSRNYSGGTGTFNGNISVNSYIVTPTNTNLSLLPNGTGNIYFGNAGNGNTMYHYSKNDDGVYTIFDHTTTQSRFNTTGTAGFRFEKDILVNGTLSNNGYHTITSTSNEHLKLAYNASYDWRIYREGSPSTGDLVFATNQNGTVSERLRLEVSNSIATFAGEVRGVAFRDTNNTNRVLDPSGTSTIDTLNTVGNLTILPDSGASFRHFNQTNTNRRLTINQNSGSYPRIYNYDGVSGTFHEIIIGGANDEVSGLYVGGSGDINMYNTVNFLSSNANLTISGDTAGNIYYSNSAGEHRWRANGSSVNSMTLSSSQLTVNENTVISGTLEADGSFKLDDVHILGTGAIGLNRDTSNGNIYNSNYSAFQLQHNRSIDAFELQAYNGSGTFQDRFVFTNSGKFGIGTSLPGQKLEVNGGNVKFSHQQNGVSRLELYQNRQDAGNVGVWTIAAYNASEIANISFFRGSGGSSGYTKIFSKKNNTSSLEEVVQFGANDALTSTFRGDVVVEGNISIPNASAYKIDGTDILEHNTSYTQLNNPEGATCIYVGDSADRTNYYDNNTHRFRTAGGTGIYGDWNSTGLGVGTTSPSTKFHVYGDAVDNQSLGLFTNTYSSGGVFFPALKAVHTHSNHSYGIVAEFRTEAGAGTDRSAILFTNAHSASNWAVGQGVVGAIDDFAVGYRSAHPNTAPGWATGYFRISTAGDVSISNNIKSPIYYDLNNTAYYVHPDSLSHLNIVRVPGDIRGNGSQLVLNAGESAAYATGQTGELVYINAEGGLRVSSSPDNWSSGWAGRREANICDSSGNSQFPGTVRHEGLNMSSGTNVDQIYEVSMSFTLTANTWTDTGINSTDLATGTYVVQVFVSDHNAGGGHYSEYYSGTMSWYAANTNSTNVDEIVLHNAGHASNASHLQLRTQRHASGGDDLMLQVKQNFTHSTALDGTSGKQMVFKFRRLI